MRVLPLLLLAALLVHPALAHTAAKAAPATPIRYSRDLPPSVARLLPRGAKSLFWGTFAPEKGGALKGVYLFNRILKGEDSPNTEVVLALFERRKQQWGQLKLVSLNVSDQIPVVNAKFFWLDTRKSVPLLKLRLFVEGEVGPVGEEVAVSFPKGFSQSATIQSWMWGDWQASISVGQTLDWSQRDDKGFLEVVCHVGTNLQDHPEQITIWRWDGQKFTPRSS